MGLLDATNAFVTCTTLELSTQSLNKDIPSFFTRSPSVPMSTIRIFEFSDGNAFCSMLLFPYPLVLPLSRVPWVPVNVQRSAKAHVCRVCVHYSVGSKRSNRASISVLANFLHICWSLID
jgi:hypothetical protein